MTVSRLRRALVEHERRLIEEALRRRNGVRTWAAADLGIAESVMRQKIKDLRIDVPSGYDRTAVRAKRRRVLIPIAMPDPAAEVERLAAEVRRLQSERDTPHTSNFLEAVRLEALHQRERWGADHDAGKSDADWFWLVGYLAGKALTARASQGDVEKALHHTITTAAALMNWHAAITGDHTRMRPGIDPSDGGES